MLSASHAFRCSPLLLRYIHTTQSPFAQNNLFEVFGISPTFDVLESDVTRKYKQLIQLHHPDRFQQKSAEEQEKSESTTRLINEAYRTLLDPLRRGLHLLELQHSPLPEKDLHMDPETIEMVYSVNEELSDLKDPKRLEEIKALNDGIRKSFAEKISAAFKRNDVESTKKLLSQLKYFSTIEERIRAAELELGVVR